MVRTVLNKIFENLGEIIFSGMIVVVGPIIKGHESVCISIVSRLTSYPRITVFVMALGVLGVAFGAYLLLKRVFFLNRKCEALGGRITNLENPMRNLILEDGASIYKDTENDRFICPRCFAEKKIRSYLEREARGEYSYEAYSYSCHVCGFKTCDITESDKDAASKKAKRVEANRDAMFSDGVYGCV